MLIPATRPWRLAYVPSAMCTGLAGDEVGRLGAVAGGPHVGGRRRLAVVDPDRVVHPELDASRARQLGPRADADAEHDEVGVDRARRT